MIPRGSGEVISWREVQKDLAQAIDFVPQELRGKGYDPIRTEGSKVRGMMNMIEKRFDQSPSYYELRPSLYADRQGFEEAISEWYVIYKSYH